MPSHYGPTIDFAMKRFRATYKVRKPIVLKTVDGPTLRRYCKMHGIAPAYAVCESYKNMWRILLQRNLKTDVALDSLIHELAHVLDCSRHGWPIDEDDWFEQHRDTWGAAFSEVYRLIYGEFDDGAQ